MQGPKTRGPMAPQLGKFSLYTSTNERRRISPYMGDGQPRWIHVIRRCDRFVSFTCGFRILQLCNWEKYWHPKSNGMPSWGIGDWRRFLDFVIGTQNFHSLRGMPDRKLGREWATNEPLVCTR